MKLEITREFSFSAAHHLTDYNGACERPHGHTYRLAVTVTGSIQKNGLVIDFVLLKKIVEETVIDKLDHTDLNDAFKNPSAELVTVWTWKVLKKALMKDARAVRLTRIRLWEGEKTSVAYEGN